MLNRMIGIRVLRYLTSMLWCRDRIRCLGISKDAYALRTSNDATRNMASRTNNIRGFVFGITLLIALGMILLPKSVLAQKEPVGRWWRSSQVSKQLKLTNSEIQRLENAYNQSRRSIIKHKGRVESEQFELQTMVENRNAGSATIKAQHRKLEKARSDLAASKFDFVVEARKIIGHDRFQKLLKMQSGSKATRKKGRK